MTTGAVLCLLVEKINKKPPTLFHEEPKQKYAEQMAK